MTTTQHTIVSDKQITHAAGTTGPRVTRVQVIELAGKRYEISFWSQFETGKLLRVDSREIQA